MSWRLPTSLKVNGAEYEIRTDYRDILTILQACSDPELPAYAQQVVMLQILYKDWKSIPEKDLEEASLKAVEFIDMGKEAEDKGKTQPRLMDWEQDEMILVPAINRVSGTGDVRSVQYMHWWTFLGYYMEIGESLFSSVLSIRSKKATGKKLEAWEKEFYRENKDIIELKRPLSEAEKQLRERERKAIEEIFG